MASRSASDAHMGDVDASQYAAHDSLPTCDQVGTSELRSKGEENAMETTEKGGIEVGLKDRKHLIERILGDDTEVNNELFLRKLRARLDR